MSSYLKNSKLEIEDQEYFERTIFADSHIYYVTCTKEYIEIFFGVTPDFNWFRDAEFMATYQKYFSHLSENRDKKKITVDNGIFMTVTLAKHLVITYNEKYKRKSLPRGEVFINWSLA